MSLLRRRIGLLLPILFGLTGLVLTILSLVPEITQLSYSVTRSTLLTEQPEAEGLVGEYYFDEKQIELLWQLELRLANSGNRTLVGQGQIANVLNEGIHARVPADYRILRADVYRNDPDVEVVLDGEEGLVLGFAQWRSGEVVELVLYAEAVVVTWGTAPEVLFGARQLVDGEIVHVAIRDEDHVGPVGLLDRFGGILAAIVRILGSVVLVVLIFFSGTLFVMALQDFATAAKARTHDYDAEVEEWLAEHPDLNGDMQERVRAAAGKLMGSFVARKVLLDAEIERKELETFPTPAHQPTFKSHRTRTIVAICGALLTLLLAALAAELIFSLTLM